ncbi:SP_0198 family lipoprotein [Streptococcus merionis]|uniref:Lipoprotein n=1 Tax=Streptococcus merionis TaxID=400065 RepID=A0A239SZI8_9STRE|nr:SP_0198 family lipoprotein [Streptococcus merionis]SNU90736.1 lipoprotein [Streptococcus merionis]
MKMKISKSILLPATMIFALFLVACSNTQNQVAPETSTSQSSTTSSSSTAASSSTSASNATGQTTGELDGTYKGRDEEDEVTLVITGTSGTWTQVEPDGEQEIKNVTLDPANQRIIIGDDAERYLLEGNQLTIKDIDEDDFNETIVLTKQ